MRKGQGFAPGKVILLGEHSVVYGRPAIAGSIDRYVSVRVTAVGTHPAGGGVHLRAAAHADARLHQALETAVAGFGLRTEDLDVTAVTDLPISVGLGSSAALSVALIRALAAAKAQFLPTSELCARAFELEKIFHGTPSGIDSTVTAMEGLIEFSTQSAARRIMPRRAIPLVVALGRVPRATAEVVTRVRARHAAEGSACEAIFDEIGALASAAPPLIKEWNLPALGELMNRNQTLLQKLEVSTPELDSMVDLARSAGVLGVKLTGGGGGGAVICLRDQDPESLINVFERNGWTAFVAAVGAQEDHDADDDFGSIEENSDSAF